MSARARMVVVGGDAAGMRAASQARRRRDAGDLEIALGPAARSWSTPYADPPRRGVGGRLLGAQIVGREGAAKRIDVFATAIWNGMAADEMVNLDLSYAPPFSPSGTRC